MPIQQKLTPPELPFSEFAACVQYQFSKHCLVQHQYNHHHHLLFTKIVLMHAIPYQDKPYK